MNRKIALLKDDIYNGDLILINHDYPIRHQNKRIKFQNFRVNNKSVDVDYRLTHALENILKDIKSDGRIIPVSGYRSFYEQTKLYEDSLIENGKEFTECYVALPNHSEHQSGLAIDLSLNQEDIDLIRPNFPNEGISKVFRDISVLHGLIERYQEDKESITKISAEEWHFRYIGYPHSKIMSDHNFSLEEYITYLQDFKRHENHLVYQNYDISFLEYTNETITVELDENEDYSGNNVNGFIFTRVIR